MKLLPPPILELFAFEHLPPKLREVSQPFGELARRLVETLPDTEERDVALRKLLEGKDAAVRARLSKGPHRGDRVLVRAYSLTSGEHEEQPGTIVEVDTRRGLYSVLVDAYVEKNGDGYPTAPLVVAAVRPLDQDLDPKG